MSASTQNVCVPLPNTITNKITTYEGREQFLVKYLEKTLPTTDSKDVLQELKRTFILDKHKSWRDKKVASGGKGKNSLKTKLSGHKIIGKNHGLVYKELLPMNEMWIEYIRQNLGIRDFKNLPKSPTESSWEMINQRLLKADYHGAIIEVVRSKSSSSVGMKGIILQETKNCFRIVTARNQLKTIPKHSSLLRFHLPNAFLEVFGKELCYKPAERSVKKFKAIHLGEL